MPYLFEHSTIEINSLDALAKQLKMLEDQPGCQVIRGQLIEGRENQAIRRTSRYRGSQEANFESCSRPWCANKAGKASNDFAAKKIYESCMADNK